MADKNLAGDRPIPREHADDFIPFPNNKHFRSQNVLSEDLRDEIWRRVKEDGKSVREVSVELQVEMRRVGAVVRLKAVEESWRREVRSKVSSFLILTADALPVEISK